MSLGVPVILCKHGIKRIVPLKMNDEERTEFFDAARTVKKTTYELEKMLNKE